MTESGDRETIYNIRKSKIVEVVHIGGDNKFKVSENDAEISDEGAHNTGRHDTEKEVECNRFNTMNKYIDDVKCQ
jgi:hypothetical protein